MHKFLLTLLIILSCSINSFAQEITVAAAANLQPAIQEIAAAFTQQTLITIIPVIGSSGKLTAQIENGAPFDIFLSADTDFPIRLTNEHLTIDQPRIYAYGSLILWTMRNELKLTPDLAILNDPSIKKIAIANPQAAPYGRQAINSLKGSNIYTDIASKLIYGESIAQTNQFISTKSADIGFTAKSVVMDDEMKNKGYWIDVDPALYEPIAQGCVILKHAQNQLEIAQRFVEFLFSKEGQTIFTKYGYRLPNS